MSKSIRTNDFCFSHNVTMRNKHQMQLLHHELSMCQGKNVGLGSYEVELYTATYQQTCRLST